MTITDPHQPVPLLPARTFEASPWGVRDYMPSQAWRKHMAMLGCVALVLIFAPPWLPLPPPTAVLPFQVAGLVLALVMLAGVWSTRPSRRRVLVAWGVGLLGAGVASGLAGGSFVAMILGAGAVSCFLAAWSRARLEQARERGPSVGRVNELRWFALALVLVVCQATGLVVYLSFRGEALTPLGEITQTTSRGLAVFSFVASYRGLRGDPVSEDAHWRLGFLYTSLGQALLGGGLVLLPFLATHAGAAFVIALLLVLALSALAGACFVAADATWNRDPRIWVRALASWLARPSPVAPTVERDAEPEAHAGGAPP